jgi:hypothetical protein
MFVSLLLTFIVCYGALIVCISIKPSKLTTYKYFCIKLTKKFPYRKTEFLFEKICSDFPNGVWAEQISHKELQKSNNVKVTIVSSFEVAESFYKSPS